MTDRSGPPHRVGRDDSGISAARAGRRTYRLGEVSDRTGLSARRVREYERLGLIEGVVRTAGGQRLYGAEHLERLQLIDRLRRTRMPLADVRLTIRVLSHHTLGIEAEGIRRLRVLLAALQDQLTVVDELARALERRLAPGVTGTPAAPQGRAWS